MLLRDGLGMLMHDLPACIHPRAVASAVGFTKLINLASKSMRTICTYACSCYGLN